MLWTQAHFHAVTPVVYRIGHSVRGCFTDTLSFGVQLLVQSCRILSNVAGRNGITNLGIQLVTRWGYTVLRHLPKHSSHPVHSRTLLIVLLSLRSEFQSFATLSTFDIPCYVAFNKLACLAVFAHHRYHVVPENRRWLLCHYALTGL